MNGDVQPSALAAKPGEGALRPYLRAIRAHRVAFVAVLLATLAASGAWISLRSDTYEATAHILVTPLPQDDQDFLGFELLRDSGDPTRTVQTAATLIESRAAADRVAGQLGRGWTGQRVMNRVEVDSVGESNIVAVTAEADGAALAARLANAFTRASLAARQRELQRQIETEIARLRPGAEAAEPGTGEGAARRIEQLESLAERGDPTLSLSQAAVPPDSPSGPGLPLVIALALLAGLALATGTAVVLELTARRIRDEEEATALYPVPVLARVPEVPRRAFSGPDGGPTWVMPPIVREAFRTLLVQLDRDGGRKTIMVTSASTGDGKTTSAVNLAVSLAAAGRSAILMDFDIRKPDVSRILRVKDEHQLVSLLDPEVQLEELLVPAPHIPALSVLGTGGAGKGDFALVEGLSRRLPQLLAEAREAADFVVIDTAPVGEVSDALRFAHEVDDILVVTRPAHTNRVNFEFMRELLDSTGQRATGLVVIGAVQGASSRYYAYGTGTGPQASVAARLGRRRRG